MELCNKLCKKIFLSTFLNSDRNENPEIQNVQLITSTNIPQKTATVSDSIISPILHVKFSPSASETPKRNENESCLKNIAKSEDNEIEIVEREEQNEVHEIVSVTQSNNDDRQNPDSTLDINDVGIDITIKDPEVNQNVEGENINHILKDTEEKVEVKEEEIELILESSEENLKEKEEKMDIMLEDPEQNINVNKVVTFIFEKSEENLEIKEEKLDIMMEHSEQNVNVNEGKTDLISEKPEQNIDGALNDFYKNTNEDQPISTLSSEADIPHGFCSNNNSVFGNEKFSGDERSKRLSNKYGDLGGELILLNIPNPNLSKCSLGLKLTGNKDFNLMNIFICQIVPNSLADIDGRLQVGDEILEVDDHILFGRSHLNATPIIKSCNGKVIRYVIHRSNDWQTNMAIPIAIRWAEEIQSGVNSRRNSDVDCLATHQDQTNSRKASCVSLGQIPYIPSLSTEETHIVYLSKSSQGLGFAIMEGSFTNESGIYIKHLAVQGPAVQDGSLRPGDKLISIDYQDVSNSSYDTVLELLKNIKSQVRLVVARVRCSNSPSHSSDSPIQNNYRKRLSAPHIAALPNYNRQKSPTIEEERLEQISPGILMTLSPESESGLTGLAKSLTDANSRRRSSVANTQSPDIVNVLLNNLEDDENVENIIIKRDDQALGISIIGGSDTFIGDVFVHDIFPNGAIALDGRVKVGDRIMVINDIYLNSKSNEEILNMLHSPAEELHLKIRHQNSPIPDQDIYEVVSTIELMKKPSKGLGISVIGRECAKGVFIGDVVKGGVASVDGRLKSGDQILEINGEDFRNKTLEDAATKLKILMGLIVFKIGRIQQLKQFHAPSYLFVKGEFDDNNRQLNNNPSGHGHSPARTPLASPAHAMS